MQFIAPGGRRASGAEASFLTLAHARGKGFWLALYRYLPGFAPVSELAYAFIAKRRPAFFRMSLMLWGRNHQPPRYELVSFLFLRLFGLITFCAFVSFAVQAQGLIGSRGILPLSELVDAIAPASGPSVLSSMPMLFWLNDSDLAIQAVCWAGAGLSLMLVFNLLPRLSLVLIYALYLSLLYAGQTFMTFQWDTFLLETAVVALLMSFCADHRRLARALALVPLHVHVGGRQADQRRSQLAQPLGAQLPLSDPAAADAARVVRREPAGSAC